MHRRVPAVAPLLALGLSFAVAVSVAAPSRADAASRCPTNETPGALSGAERFDANRLVGKTVRRARRLARRHDCFVRVVKRDGVLLIVTQDFQPYRINVAVRDHVVKRVVGIG